VTTPPLFPLPEPPAADVAELLDELRTARRELQDAGRILHMVTVDPLDGDAPRIGRRRETIEATVAERRCELWAAEVAAIEQRGRQLGLDVSAVL
jgi:hypothetical protein